MTDFRAFWGKARPRGGERHGLHPAWAHGLDVAAAGSALVRARPRPFATIARRLGWNIDDLEALWLHHLALHDIGKFSPLFQRKVPECYPIVAIALPDAEALKVFDPGHPAAGYALLKAWLDGEATPAPRPSLFAHWDCGEMARLLNPILGHHGRPIALPNDDWRRFYRPIESAQAAFAYWQVIAKLLPVPDNSST